MKLKVLLSFVFALSILVASVGMITAQEDGIVFGMVLVGPSKEI